MSDPAADPRKWVQIAEHVTHRIAAGELAPGDMVTITGLCHELHVTRQTARRALRMLEERGLLTACGKKGFMVISGNVPDDEQEEDESHRPLVQDVTENIQDAIDNICATICEITETAERIDDKLNTLIERLEQHTRMHEIPPP